MKKKKENETNKIKFPPKLDEATGIKVAKLFYRQIDLISQDTLKDESVCEELKKRIFESVMINFDEMDDDEKQCYIIAASAGWAAGMTVLRELLALNENNKDGK